MLSGWLKADAPCRVEGRACDAGGEVRAGRREGLGCGGGTQEACTGPDSRLGAKGTRGAHVEHVAHGRDAGGVQAQRLVEGRRGLPSRREGMRCGGGRCEPGGRRACGVWWRHDTSGMHGEDGPSQGLGAKGTRGERTANMAYMSVMLEVSKLSGWLKADADCRVEGRACDAGGGGASREAGGPGVVAAHKRHARGKGPTQGWGPRARAGSAQRPCSTCP